MSLTDFMDLTPVVFSKIYNKFLGNRMQFFEYQQIANYVGYGQVMGGKKFKSVFKHKEQRPSRKVTYKEKMSDLSDLQKRLGNGVDS
jgi:hypothetical protein